MFNLFFSFVCKDNAVPTINGLTIYLSFLLSYLLNHNTNLGVGFGPSSNSTTFFVYDLEDSLEEKINKIVKTIYGGDGVIFTDKAKKQIKQLADWGLDRLPVCMAKTQYSLSDNPALLGAPTGFTITVSDIRVANGAGFIVCRTGDVMVMPGLPKRPAALNMDIEADGTIKGLF